MLSQVVPFLIYLLSYPIMLITIFKVEIGIIFFITVIPLIVLMKKLLIYPAGNSFGDFLLGAIMIGWFFNSLKEGKKLFISSPINIAVILMVIGSIINLIRGYTFMSFSEEINLERLMTWKNYMILPVIYYIAANNLKTEKIIKIIIFCILLTLLASDFNFQSTFQWFKAEHYEHSMRISGAFTFLGPNEMGVFYCVSTFMLLGIAYFTDNRLFRYFLLIVSAANFYPIIYSYSRAAYSASLVGFLTLGFLKDRRLLLVPIILILFYTSILPTSVVERIDETFLNKAEVSEEEMEFSGFDVGGTTIELTGRIHLWEKAKGYFMEHPILGTGFDTFRHQEGFITHSLFYKILAEQGLLGVFIHLIFYGVLLQQSFKLFRNSSLKLGKGIGLGFFVSIIVHLTGSISGDQTLYYNIMAIFWLFMGIVARFNVYFIDGTLHQE